jgi:fused signal recognition particle receptor
MVQIDIIKQRPGADASAVVYDALAAAKRRGNGPVIVDTVGRLHSKYSLTSSGEDVRHASREVPNVPHQVLR